MTTKPTLWHSLHVVYAWLSPRRRTHVALLFGLSLAGAMAELLTLGAILPFLALLADPTVIRNYSRVGQLFDVFGWTEPVQILTGMTVLFGVIVLCAAGIRLVLTWTSVRLTQAIGHELGLRIYERVLHQPYGYHVAKNSSEILSGVLKVDAIVAGILTPSMDVMIAGIMAASILAGLLIIDWSVAILAAGSFGVLYWGLSTYSRRRIVANSRTISHAATGRVQVIQEGLGGIRDVLLDGSQSFHLSRFRGYDITFRQAFARNSLWGQTPRYLVEALGIGVIAGIAAVTAIRAGGMVDALPTLGALAIGAQRLLPLFQRLYAGWNSLTGNLGNLEDVAALANAPVLIGVRGAPEPTHLPFASDIALHGVGFRYRDDSPWVFRGISLRIPRGARIGFAGRTGCGKSTLLDLVMGLLPPSEGNIEIDGKALTPLNLRHWQARIAHVPQSIFLTDTTIAANIAFNEPSDKINLARVEAAARRARIHDFIATLDCGYGTLVGERGVRLSGGQRQRIGIARALYRHADVLVLDEATSALDGATEASVMDGVRELGTDITVLIVAHRLSTLTECDIVVRMDAPAHPAAITPTDLMADEMIPSPNGAT